MGMSFGPRDAEILRKLIPSLCICVSASLWCASAQQLTCKGGRCERIITGSVPTSPRLRVEAHGPVTLEAGASAVLYYTVRVTVNARTQAQARRLLSAYAVRTESQGSWTVFTAPGGAI